MLRKSRGEIKVNKNIEKTGIILLCIAATVLLVLMGIKGIGGNVTDALPMQSTPTETEPWIIDAYTLSPESLSTYSREMMVELMATGSVTVGNLTLYLPQKQTAATKPVETAEPIPTLTEVERRMITIVAVNADHTNNDSMLGIIKVIYNRLHSDRFPDTIEAILTAPKQFESCFKIYSYAFTVYDYDKIGKLVDRVFADGYDPFDGVNAVYYSAATVPQSRIAKNLRLTKTIGRTNFYEQG